MARTRSNQASTLGNSAIVALALCGRALATNHGIHEGVDVGEAGLRAAPERAPVGQLVGEELRMRAILIAHERHRAFQGLRGKAAAAHRGAVLLEILRHQVADLAEDDRDRRLEDLPVGPEADGVGRAAVLRRQARRREAPLQLAQDDLRIAEHVGADLHHRNLAIAAGQRDKIGFGHDHRLHHRAPRQFLDAERDAHLLRERRIGIIVEDDLVGHGLSSARSRTGYCRSSGPRARRRGRPSGSSTPADGRDIRA